MVSADEIRIGPNVNEIKLRVYELSPGNGESFGYMSSSVRMWTTFIFDLDDDDDMYWLMFKIYIIVIKNINDQSI